MAPSSSPVPDPLKPVVFDKFAVWLPETLVLRLPLRSYSSTWADTLALLGHATVVDHVGTDVSAPLAGFS